MQTITITLTDGNIKTLLDGHVVHYQTEDVDLEIKPEVEELDLVDEE